MPIVKLVLVLAVFLLTSGQAVAEQSPDRLSDRVTLTIGAIKVAHLATLPRVAEQLDALNVELRIVEFMRYADARTALATGSIDLATVGPPDLPIALSQGINTIYAISGVGSQPKYPVVRNGVEIAGWQDLRGKRVAVAPGSAVWFQFVAKLQEVGVSYRDLNVVNIQGGGAAFAQALERGDVDVIVTWEPFESMPVVGEYGYWATALDYSDSDAVGGELGMIAASRRALRDKRPALKRFMWAFEGEQLRFQEDQSLFALEVSKWTGIDQEISRRIVSNINLHSELSVRQLQLQAKAFHEFGVIQRDVSDQLPEFVIRDLRD